MTPATTHRVAGLLSGLAAGAWLGAAEVPTKLVTLGAAPVVLSLLMVLGVFLGRWSLPALLHGTRAVQAEARQYPHLLVWAVLAGALWSVANTLTVYAIRDVGLSIAFPLWNANSILGILWGALFFNELRDGGARTWWIVLGGTVVMLAGGTMLALASATAQEAPHAARGIIAALAAGAMWGTMYIPYRKAYITGMSPLAFVTFFTIGEVVTMTLLALWLTGGIAPLQAQVAALRPVLFFLLAGGLVWVVGDLFQQYAAKHLGISRGIPLSNTNQLWGLAWGVLAFGEWSASPSVRLAVIGGSVLMAVGAAAVALAAPGTQEQAAWATAAARERARYGISETSATVAESRIAPGWLDWLIAAAAVAVLGWAFVQARRPELPVATGAAWLLTGASVVLAGVAVRALRGRARN